MNRLGYSIFVAAYIILQLNNLNAQISIDGFPESYTDKTLISEAIPTIVLSELDIQSILDEDNLSLDTALRIGRLIYVDLDILKNSLVSCSTDETVIHRLKIIAPNAKAIELIT